MVKADMYKLLDTISTTAAIKSSKYGVHYYEHDRNAHYRPCPEAFIVDAVLHKLKKINWRVTAEAHQGGVWGLFGKENELPKYLDKMRYDLVLWKRTNKPAVVCEFKWGFSQRAFRKDAENLSFSGGALGVHPVLCLLGVKADKNKLDGLLSTEEQFIKEKYGIWASSKSKIYKTPRYFCGQHFDEEYSYSQAISLCLPK